MTKINICAKRNVLLTCAGRRTYLAEYFRRETAACGGKVYAADLDASAPALAAADHALEAPAIFDADYAEWLIDTCRRLSIGLLVPLNDFELSAIAAISTRLGQNGTVAVISSPYVVEACSDKAQTFNLLKSIGIDMPATCTSLSETLNALRKGLLRFPIVIKPRRGSGSACVGIAVNSQQLQCAWQYLKDQARRTLPPQMMADGDGLIAQQMVEGTEYGLDIINDLAGQHRAVAAKRKISMRSGETDRAEIIDDPALTRLGQKLGAALSHIGNLDCDVMRDADGRDWVIELNPRFGGGYPFSHMAGCNLPAALLRWACGQEIDPALLRAAPGLVFSKAPTLIPCPAPVNSKFSHPK